MKKILFALAIFLVAVSVSACTKNQPLGEENNTPQNSSENDNYNSADANQTPAPIASPDAVAPDQATVTTTPVQIQTTMPVIDNQTNLLKEYSGALIKTSLGNITVKFYNTGAPLAVNNFLTLAKAGFFNSTKFHRVMKDFMIQGGDPNSKGTDTSIYGTGGPGYQFKNEDSGQKLVAGSLAMANSGPDTNGSQFFIVTASSTPWLDGSYTNFGHVTGGMDIVNKISNVAVTASPSGEISLPVTPIIVTGVELLK